VKHCKVCGQALPEDCWCEDEDDDLSEDAPETEPDEAA
jgi:predicted nucleic acid-binding Zn ribbon protein